jgi:hypothetical protein
MGKVYVRTCGHFTAVEILLTARSETNDAIGSNDAVCPVALLLQIEHKIFLCVVEVQPLVFISGQIFCHRTKDRPKVRAVVLHINISKLYLEIMDRMLVYLPACLEAYPLQVLTSYLVYGD